MIKQDFLIGDYLVSPNTRTIQVGDESIQLQPRVMDLLCYLSSKANQVISRDELVEQVWHGTVVSDDAIHRTISILRSTLTDNPKNPQYLETIPKTGYRVIAPITMVEDERIKSVRTSQSRYFFTVFFILVVLVMSSWYFLYQDNTITVTVPKIRYLTSHNGLEYNPQFSPTANELIYTQYNKGWEGSFVIGAKVGSLAEKIDIDVRFIDSIWSPDGKSIYSHEQTPDSCMLVKHSLSGLPSQNISECITKSKGMMYYMDVSYDEKLIVTSERNSNTPRQLYRIDVATGNRRPFFKTFDGIGDYFPKFSPDNKWLAFARGFSSNSRELMIVPVDGGKPTQLTFDDAYIQDLAWTSNSSLVFNSNRQSGISGLWYVKTDGSEPVWLNTIIDGIERFDVSYDDQFLAFQTWYQPFNVYKIQLNALDNGMNESHALTFSKKENSFPSISPDGNFLTFVSNRTGNYALWIAESDGSNPKLLVDNVLKYAAPEWSPDSLQISFTMLKGGQGDVCITNLDGKYTCVKGSDEDELFPTWSKDQKHLYFTQMSMAEDSHYINYQYNLLTGTISETGIKDAINVRESNNPDVIYFNEAVTSKIYKLNRKTKNKELLVDDFYDVYYKSWYLSDDGIYYYSKNKEFRFYNFNEAESELLIPSDKVGGYGTFSGMYVDNKTQNIIMSMSPMTLNGDIGLVENFIDLLPPH